MTAAAAPQTLVATEEVECWYEYSANLKESQAKGHRRIDSADDPRWDGELMLPPFSGDPRGYLNVARVTRVNGEIVKKVGIHGGTYHKNNAQEFLRNFAAAKAAGAEKPWDQDHFHRDMLVQAEKAKSEGRTAELEIFKQILLEVTKGGHTAAEAKLPPAQPDGDPKVSRGSPVRAFSGSES